MVLREVYESRYRTCFLKHVFLLNRVYWISKIEIEESRFDDLWAVVYLITAESRFNLNHQFNNIITIYPEFGFGKIGKIRVQ